MCVSIQPFPVCFHGDAGECYSFQNFCLKGGIITHTHTHTHTHIHTHTHQGAADTHQLREAECGRELLKHFTVRLQHRALDHPEGSAITERWIMRRVLQG